MINKTSTYILVSLILTGAVTWSALSYIHNSDSLESSKTLLSSAIFEEALQELCPFPGFHGNYCPGPMAPKANYFRTGTPIMPSGIGASFDITTGDLKLPSIQLTYSSNEQIWTDPVSYRQFAIPDEVNIQDAPSSAETKIFQDTNQFSSIWRDALERGEWLGGQYHSQKDVNELFEQYFNGDQQTSVSQLTKGVVRLSFKTNDLKLNKFAQRAIDSLPQQFDESIYNQFLDSWGTHISVDTNIGGMVEKQTVFKECVYASPSFTGGLSTDQLTQALNNELHGNQGDAYFTARRRVSIDRKLGGNPEDVNNWEQTISANPALLKINRFVSWSDLVSDPQIKANLQSAIWNRVQAMKSRLAYSQAQVDERRRQQKTAPKSAYLIQKGNNNFSFTPFQMLTSSQCPSVTPFQYKQQCITAQIYASSFINISFYFGYERDNEGHFRAFQGISQLQLYGQFLENGCSLPYAPNVQSPEVTQLDFQNSPLYFACTGCLPENISGGRFACSCPGF